MSEGSAVSIVDRQFGKAYPFADEKGKPDTAFPPGCLISTTGLAGVRVVTENRVESYVFQGSTVIEREPTENTLNLDVFLPPNSSAKELTVGHPTNQGASGFRYRAHYTQNGNASAEVASTASTDKQGLGCLIV
ncbi:hypothetical protein H1R20_g9637, partial [Candolleomyces eurysporus]